MPILINLHVFWRLYVSEFDIYKKDLLSYRAEMFSCPRLTRYKVYRVVLKHKHVITTTVRNFEEPVVQAICWTDPYALVTVVNSPRMQTRYTVIRLVGELFFDQQARTLFHSSDVTTFILLVCMFHVKDDLVKQASRKNDL